MKESITMIVRYKKSTVHMILIKRQMEVEKNGTAMGWPLHEGNRQVSI